MSDEGARIHALMRELFPLPRSLTGDGVRATLRAVGELLPQLELVEIPTGTPLYDWVAPREWAVREAWIEGPDGRRLVDAADSSLHLVGYSVPVDATLTGRALDAHLHSLPDRPGLVPYLTAYWADTWGFCLAHRVRETVDPDAAYRVRIDATLAEGALTCGEAYLPGESEEEVLLSTYVCHPALANDNLSGVALLAVAGARLTARPRRLSYRLAFGPGTLGPLAWLTRHEDGLGRVRAALGVNCVGDPGPVRYKRSLRGDARVDRAAVRVLAAEPGAVVEDFVPWGGDERQPNAPGFGLAMGTLTRTPHGLFPEYHTSADDLDLVRPEALADSLRVLEAILAELERPQLRRLGPPGEPQLGRRGLYREIALAGPPADPAADARQRAIMWVLALADGDHAEQDVAERSGLPVAVVEEAVRALGAAGLVEGGHAADHEEVA